MSDASSSSTALPTAPLNIFINYRRSDSGGYAGRIYDALMARSPDWHVFMDIDNIDPGVDFTEVIDEALATCDVVIAVIGRQWLTITNKKGRRRLDDPDDLVRLELETALGRHIRVIPALVQGAEMPGSEDLPDALIRLARRNALELSDARWRYDTDRLIAVLDQVQQKRDERDPARDEPKAAPEADREHLEQERIERGGPGQQAGEGDDRERRTPAKTGEPARGERRGFEGAEDEPPIVQRGAPRGVPERGMGPGESDRDESGQRRDDSGVPAVSTAAQQTVHAEQQPANARAQALEEAITALIAQEAAEVIHRDEWSATLSRRRWLGQRIWSVNVDRNAHVSIKKH